MIREKKKKIYEFLGKEYNLFNKRIKVVYEDKTFIEYQELQFDFFSSAVMPRFQFKHLIRRG